MPLCSKRNPWEIRTWTWKAFDAGDTIYDCTVDGDAHICKYIGNDFYCRKGDGVYERVQIRP